MKHTNKFTWWQKLSIKTKFNWAFGILLLLVLLVSVTSYVALNIMRWQTERTIITSTEIESLVLEMKAGLEESGRLQRDFFLHYPEIGLSAAQQIYAQHAISHLGQVISLSSRLETLISQADIHLSIQQKRTDLTLYLSTAQRQSDTFSETVELVTTLAAQDTGLQSQLTQQAHLLQNSLEQSNNPELMFQYWEMRSFEKDYIITKQRPFIQYALNIVRSLKKAIENDPSLTQQQRTEALSYLNNYKTISNKIANLDVAIKSKFKDFDLQTEAIEPISEQLIELARADVEQGREQIKQTNRFTTAFLIIIGLTSFLSTAIIGKILNNSITLNIINLTQIANNLQAGQLEITAEINSADELGHLATTFNAMSQRINRLVNTLEERVHERTRRLETIATVSGKLNAILDFDHLLIELVKQIKQRFNYYAVLIYMINDAKSPQNTPNKLMLRAGIKEDGKLMALETHYISLQNKTNLVAKAARGHEIITVEDVKTLPDWSPHPMLPDTCAEMAVPIIWKDQVMGVLNVQENKVAALDEGDTNLLRSLASHIAIALTNARLFKQNQTVLAETEKLYRISKRMISANNISELIAAVVEEISISVINKAVLLAFERNEYDEIDAMVCQANWHNGQGVKPTAIGTRYHKNQLQVGELFIRSEPLFFKNMQQDTRINANTFEFVKKRNIQAMAILPLWHQGIQIGVLLLQGEKPYQFTTKELNPYLSTLGQLAIAVQNQILFEETQQRTIELTEAKESAEQAKQAAEAASQAKSEFLSNMSHELRTPLNGILGYTQILKRTKNLSTLQSDGLNIIQQSGNHLLTLINDILDLSKIEAGKINLKYTSIYLPSFLEEIASLIRMQAYQKDISFIYQPLTTLPDEVEVDEKRLRQVLLNLLTNAIKFTQKGKVIFKVSNLDSTSISTQTNQMKKLRFEITDTGVGIKSEDLSKIFFPFEQVGDVELQAEGTGLGLALTQKLIEAMGSILEVESQFGKGSSFWFDLALPIVQTKTKTKKEISLPIIGYKGPRQTVLVVDDKDYNRSVLVNILEPLGFETMVAINGKQAIDLARKTKPNIILMDMIMPVMMGFEAVQYLRQMPTMKEVVIFGASASVFEEDRKRVKLAGCDEFLAKPINIKTLLYLLEMHLGLEWIYKTAPEKTATSTKITTKAKDTDLIIPSASELAIGYELAKRGSLSKIKKWAKQLIQQNEQYKTFATKILDLAKTFEGEQILALLEKHVN